MKDFKKRFREFWKKFWFVVWKDDSIKGWVISIIFLFVLIKFIFFPLLNLTTGTTLPLAIVESCSMYHQGNIFSNFDSWYERHDDKYAQFMISNLDFEDFSFKRGFNKGDILFIVGTKPEKLKEGDVIIFEAAQSNPIIHRIVNLEKVDEEYVFSTIGDNNNGQLSFEKSISEDKIVGRAVFRMVPYLGWIKLVFFEGNKSSSERGFCHEN